MVFYLSENNNLFLNVKIAGIFQNVSKIDKDELQFAHHFIPNDNMELSLLLT